MKIKYDWRRYWSPPNGRISLSDRGFLQDPMDGVGKYVNPDLVVLSSIYETSCLILLGEPGIGKSTEIERLFAQVSKEKTANRTLLINLRDIPTPEIFAKELESSPQYQEWVKNGDPLYLFLDSFDEGMFSFKSFANYLVLLLKKNIINIKSLHLCISCRTAIWQPYLDDSLNVLWGDNSTKEYELCPLIKGDVLTALKTQNIDSNKFLTEVHEKGVVGLAGKPITLQLLMEVYEKDGSLPKRKVDIYSLGCDLLAQEHDPSKKSNKATKPTLSLFERIAIAERIAFATLIGAKPTVILDDKSKAIAGEVSINELQGNEILNDTSLKIGEDQIKEVLNTGLFSSRGGGKMGWAHQTYGEFLAARYIFRHKLNWKQIRSLLFEDLLNNESFQIIPQLYEVSEWLASLSGEFFVRTVTLDPELLLLSDVNVATDAQKKELVGQLLKRLANGELIDRRETYNQTNYRKLNHPDLNKQLQGYIEDNSKGMVVRRSAIEIVIACHVSSLEKLLVKIAMNDKDDLAIRVRAVRAIGEIGSDNAKSQLRPLLISGFITDSEDELKGVTLETLYPNHISIKELFSLITPTKRSSLFGAYHAFVNRSLVQSIRSEELSEGLDWVKRNVINTRDVEYSLGKLSDAIMLCAWKNLSLPGVLGKFSEIAYKRLKDSEEIIGERTIGDEIVTSFQTAIEIEDDKRRNLIKQIVNLHIKDKDKKNGRNGYILLPYGKVRFVLSKDLPWLVKWLCNEKDEDTQKLLAEVISRVFDIHSIRDIELVYQARNNNAFLKQDTHYLFGSVKLDSDEAREQRKRWKQEQKWSKEREKDEKEEILKIISLSRIEELLKKAEAGDMDAWWQLNNAMCLYQQEFDEEDIRKLPGWKVISKETQERIIICGKPFILQQESKPEIWLGKGKIYFPALSGYRALKIYYEREKDFIEGLDKAIWKKWAPITIGMPLVSNDPENGKLITLAYKSAPDEIITTLDVLIDEDEQRHGSLFLIDLLEGCIDEKMSNFLLAKARKPGFKPKAAGDIVRFLLKHKVQSAKTYVKSLIQIPLSTDSDKKDLCLIAAVSLLWNATKEDWEFLWELFKKDKNFGRSVIESSHENPLRGSGVLQGLSEQQLAELYIWMMKEYPPENYSEPEGGHTVTPQMSIGNWRDSVLRTLMDKGTAEGCRFVEKIAKIFPDRKWIKEFTLLESKRIALQKSWQAPLVGQILKMVENHELRLVNTADELLEIVTDSLEKFENILQKGEQPQAIDLWNERRVTKKNGSKSSVTLVYSPKDENRFSDKVKTYLQEDLVSKGIVINREVEIKRGSETDIYISAFSRDQLGRSKDLLKVTIEIKGCWHDEIDTAMETQLVNRYLTGTDCDRGIYLVGWFGCDKWNDESDSRKNKCPKISIKEARKKYEEQAKQLSKQKPVRVISVTTDVRLS